MQAGVPHISEAQAVYLEKFLNTRGTIASLAAGMDVPLVDMIDILSSPAVLARIDDARILTLLKLEIIAARAEMAALETLEEITKNKSHDPIERRRAAQTIIRATRPIRARRAASDSSLPRACGGGGRVREAGGGPSQNAAPERLPQANSQIQNRIRQEAAARQRCGHNHTSNSQDPQSQSDPHSQPQRGDSTTARGIAPGEDAVSSQSPERAHQPQPQTSNNHTPDSQEPPRGTGVSPVPSDPSPRMMPAVDASIYLVDEDNLEDYDPPLQGSETAHDTPQGDVLGCDALSVRPEKGQQSQTNDTQSDESTKAQPDQFDDTTADEAQPHQSQPQEGWGGGSTTARGIAPGKDANTSPSPERATQPQNGPHKQENHNNQPEQQEGKDKPWEGHPFQIAGLKAFGRSNHDPP